MRDRQKLEAILSKRFPGATSEQIAAATNAIMGLDDEWEDAPRQVGLRVEKKLASLKSEV